MSPQTLLLFKGSASSSSSSSSPTDPYTDLLSLHDYACHSVAAIECHFVQQDQLQRELLKRDYDGLILTSPRAVEAVERVVPRDDEGEDSRFGHWRQRLVYVVGPASGQRVRRGLDWGRGDLLRGQGAGHAAQLAEVIVGEAEARGRSLRLFFPRANLAGHVLPDRLTGAGHVVTGLDVYETRPSARLTDDLSRTGFSPLSQLPRVVFFSPSGVRAARSAMQTLGWDVSALRVVALGPTTAAEVAKLDPPVRTCQMADKPTPEDVLAAVQKLV